MSEEKAVCVRIIDNVVRVFMHTPHSYTFLIKDEKTLELKLCTPRYVPPDNCTIFADVPRDKKMWVGMYRFTKGGFWGGAYDTMEIHVHSEKDINGAGWDDGEGGRGTTTVVK